MIDWNIISKTNRGGGSGSGGGFGGGGLACGCKDECCISQSEACREVNKTSKSGLQD